MSGLVGGEYGGCVGILWAVQAVWEPWDGHMVVGGELCGEMQATWGLWDGRELHVMRCGLHDGCGMDVSYMW